MRRRAEMLDRLSTRGVILLGALGIFVSILIYGPALRWTLSGSNDFRSLYPGGVLRRIL